MSVGDAGPLGFHFSLTMLGYTDLKMSGNLEFKDIILTAWSKVAEQGKTFLNLYGVHSLCGGTSCCRNKKRKKSQNALASDREVLNHDVVLCQLLTSFT